MAANTAHLIETYSRIAKARILSNLIAVNLTNRNYEGDIAMAGDTVKIPTPTTTVSVKNYSIDTDIDAAETTSGTTQDLAIDQQKYFHFYVDDIDRAQARPNIMDDAMGRAARAMALEVDTFCSGHFSTSGYNASRREGVAGDPMGKSAAWGEAFLQALIKQKLAMTNADLMLEDRWAVIPPDVLAGLENYFLIEQDAAGVWLPATQEQTLRNGYAGMLLGFSLHVTRRTVAGTAIASKATKRCVLGQGNEAVTFANQITENEAYRPERRFGDAVKGLMVYGGKNVLPDRLYYIDAQTAA